MLRGALTALGLTTLPLVVGSYTHRGDTPSVAAVVVLSAQVRDSINAIFVRSNQHWNELDDVNTLTQMLGTGKPTQLEYLGCLRGHLSRDTVWVTAWAPARGMKRLQFAVTGSCDHLPDAIGTWHTHPFRADSAGRPLKERVLSAQDLTTFAAGDERVTLAAWDVDSLDAAAKASSGVSHPAQLITR